MTLSPHQKTESSPLSFYKSQNTKKSPSIRDSPFKSPRTTQMRAQQRSISNNLSMMEGSQAPSDALKHILAGLGVNNNVTIQDQQTPHRPHFDLGDLSMTNASFSFVRDPALNRTGDFQKGKVPPLT